MTYLLYSLHTHTHTRCQKMTDYPELWTFTCSWLERFCWRPRWERSWLRRRPRPVALAPLWDSRWTRVGTRSRRATTLCRRADRVAVYGALPSLTSMRKRKPTGTAHAHCRFVSQRWKWEKGDGLSFRRCRWCVEVRTQTHWQKERWKSREQGTRERLVLLNSHSVFFFFFLKLIRK